MTSEERLKNQKNLVEEIGRHFDKEGFQPIAGRIYGLLMVMDKEQYTFDEITEELSISKSSASNALKNLEIRGDIEYVTLPGDRKRYFQLKKHDKFAIIEDSEKKIGAFKSMIKCILDLKADVNSNNGQYLTEVMDVMEYILRKMAQLKIEYNKNK